MDISKRGFRGLLTVAAAGAMVVGLSACSGGSEPAGTGSAAAGSDKSKILQTLIYLSDMSTFGEMNAVWESWVDPANTPARATSQAALATPDYKVEFTVIAAL